MLIPPKPTEWTDIKTRIGHEDVNNPYGVHRFSNNVPSEMENNIIFLSSSVI